MQTNQTEEPSWIHEKNKLLRQEAAVCGAILGGLLGVELAVIGEQHLHVSPQSMWGLLSMLFAAIIGAFITRKKAIETVKDIDFFRGCK
jgi:fructose-specific phosphotransferase system IIC component